MNGFIDANIYENFLGQVVLKEVDLPVVEHSACEAGLRRTRLGRRSVPFFFSPYYSFLFKFCSNSVIIYLDFLFQTLI